MNSVRGYISGKSTAIVLISLVLFATGISFGLRCYYQEPVSDDLLYRFVLDDNILGRNDCSRLVKNLGDAIESQSIQYFYSNGRTLIHILVQMFAGPWGGTAFAVFEGMLVVAIMTLFGFYCIPKRRRYNPLLWMLIAIAYLYLFQDKESFFSIAME